MSKNAKKYSYRKQVQIMNSKDWSVCYRHPLIEKEYDKHKKELKQQGLSTSDYINNMLNGRDHLVTFNNYKYNFEGLHLLGWWIPSQYDIDNNTQTVQQELGASIEKIVEGMEYNVAENPCLELRSVKDIRHYHIAVKYDNKRHNQWSLICHRIRNYYNYEPILQFRI